MITYQVEQDIRDFEFWGGAIPVMLRINERSDADELWDKFEYYIHRCNGTFTDTEINDLLWHDSDLVLEIDVFDPEKEEDEED